MTKRRCHQRVMAKGVFEESKKMFRFDEGLQAPQRA
jgi:hypothetical protein